MRGEMINKKSGQVWVETVIYTLIALVIIGMFIGFAKPKIEEIQDKAVVEQSVQMLEDINDIVLSMKQGGAGNQRIIDIGIKKGILKFDPVQDQIIFELEGKYTYTEPGANGQPGNYINIGSVIATTQKRGSISKVTLITNYTKDYDLTYQNTEEIKTLSSSPVPYSISVSNKGENGNRTAIDIKVLQ